MNCNAMKFEFEPRDSITIDGLTSELKLLDTSPFVDEVNSSSRRNSTPHCGF